MERPKQRVKSILSYVSIIHQNNGNEFILLSLLLTLDIGHYSGAYIVEFEQVNVQRSIIQPEKYLQVFRF